MNANLSIDRTFLDPSMHLRSPGWNDAEAVAQVIHDSCAAEGDPILAVSSEELKHEWQDPGFNLERDAFVVETPEHRVVGYAALTNSYGHAIFNMDGNVHPDFKGRGIATTLLRAVEKRARETMSLAAPDVMVSIRTTINKNEPDSNSLHWNEG